MEPNTQLKRGLSRILIVLGTFWLAPFAIGFLLILVQVITNPPQGPAAGEHYAPLVMLAMLGSPGFLLLLSGILGLLNAAPPPDSTTPARDPGPPSQIPSGSPILGGVLGTLTGCLTALALATFMGPSFLAPSALLGAAFGLILGMYLADRPTARESSSKQGETS